MFTHESAGYPRFAASGRTYLYLLPCRDQDLVKIGFSRDPLQRMHALHRRYFEFFDLDRAWLLEVEKTREARRLERLFHQHFSESRAPAPLVVRDAAAGDTEWFQGVATQADSLARQIVAGEGWTLHSPLRAWLKLRFDERSDTLYAWSSRLLESIEYERHNHPAAESWHETERTLRYMLDACEAVG